MPSNPLNQPHKQNKQLIGAAFSCYGQKQTLIDHGLLKTRVDDAIIPRALVFRCPPPKKPGVKPKTWMNILTPPVIHEKVYFNLQ
jgi:hypothetical protein